MESNKRILSIDIIRGFNLILMLFVNDLYMDGVPAWLGHRAAGFDGMGLADWVFPGFMFMAGMSIPYAIGNRMSSGESNISLLKHIMFRTLSLLLIGLLMANSRNVGGDNTGLSKNVWSFITYAGVFLIWNDYRKTPENKWLIISLKILGVIMIVPMVYLFRTPDNRTFSFHSWGILGTIGWGYLVAAIVCLATRENILKTSVALVFFLGLNILSKLHLLEFLKSVRPVLGPVINGNAPFIVLSGLLSTMIMRKYSPRGLNKPLIMIIIFGAVSLFAGFILRHWFIISKIQATPSWALVCNGLTLLLFALLFYVIDMKKYARWASFMRPAGANSLTVYLVPDMFYYIIWQFSLPILIYKDAAFPPIVVVAGSAAWALIMGAALPVLLERINFRLKL